MACLLCCGANTHSSRRAPGFSLPDTNFKRYDLQDFRGKWLLIDFMLTSCPHCTELAHTLEKVKAAKGDRIAILEVVLPPDTTATVTKFVSENKVTVPVLFDQGQMAASYFDATPAKAEFDTPHLFIIDPNGSIVRDYGHEDEIHLEPANLMKELDELMKANPKESARGGAARSTREGGRR
jgi:peroxiredoxin